MGFLRGGTSKFGIITYSPLNSNTLKRYFQI
nr:MAG TPA: hypothetical protein [Inoviridae sp.]